MTSNDRKLLAIKYHLSTDELFPAVFIVLSQDTSLMISCGETDHHRLSLVIAGYCLMISCGETVITGYHWLSLVMASLPFTHLHWLYVTDKNNINRVNGHQSV